LKKYNKVVIWGLRTQKHTHAYIHQSFYKGFVKIGANVVWVDDEVENQSVIQKNDFVIAVNVANKNLPPLEDVYYCLHNFDDDFASSLADSRIVNLQVYTNRSEENSVKWDESTFFDAKEKILYQAWGTDLFEEEFYEPVNKSWFKVCFWVGSIWNNELNQGNVAEITEFKRVLARKKIKFIHLHHISDYLNVLFTRNSRIAPAISGKWQVINNYLPCRMFKNISYGQLGISNVKKFNILFGPELSVQGATIEELVDNALSLSNSQRKEMIRGQQEIVKKHTYAHKINNILKAFEKLSS